MSDYSVLMSVYHKEQPEFLDQSLQSVFAQSIPPREVVLVCDGPLTSDLEAVIAQMCKRHGDILRLVRLEENQGLANALNHGLKACSYELVARMDTDDIALPNRCALQLEAFDGDPQLVIVGGAVDEFEGTADHIVARKVMPLGHEEIQKYARLRNPFNHPTVMYKKSVIQALGGYPQRPLHEDYALWAKLLLSGGKGRNLPQTLVRMRVDNGIYGRRGGWKYLKLASSLRWEFYKSGLCSLSDVVRACGVLAVACLTPAWVRKLLYRKFLRKKAVDSACCAS